MGPAGTAPSSMSGQQAGEAEVCHLKRSGLCCTRMSACPAMEVWALQCGLAQAASQGNTQQTMLLAQLWSQGDINTAVPAKLFAVW